MRPVSKMFTSQMASDVLHILQNNNIPLKNAPPNITKLYKSLDLTVYVFSFRFMAQKFNDWYTEQKRTQLDKGVNINEINKKLRLPLMKSLHAG